MALVAAWDQLSSFSVHSFFLFCLYEDAECDFENSLNTAVAHFAIVSVFFFLEVQILAEGTKDFF